MTIDNSLIPDLSGATCCVGACFLRADDLGTQTVLIDPLVGAPDFDERFTLELPLCEKHSHLLRMGVVESEFTTNL